jgi:hypothetical protein
MASQDRLTQIETPFHWLTDEDRCFHFGEYTSGGGYGCSETNRWISNLKKKPTVPSPELRWKKEAIAYWVGVLRKVLPPANLSERVTIVPMPGSKPLGHTEHDLRVQQVVGKWVEGVPGIDVRAVLKQTVERPSQHENARLSPAEIIQTLSIDQSQLATPLRPVVVVVDDVLTLGASFKAAKNLLLQQPGVQKVEGLFLARTVWPADDFTAEDF